MKLFDKEHVVGTFLGFSDGGLEFHADLILPYRNELPVSADARPVRPRGQLENDDEAVLGRITTVAAQGRLVSPTGEDYAIRAAAREPPVPEDSVTSSSSTGSTSGSSASAAAGATRAGLRRLAPPPSPRGREGGVPRG